MTEADVAVEKLIISRIKEKFPDHNIVAEESEHKETSSKFTWYIDPIDGTTNYSHTDPHFAVSIALAENNELKYSNYNAFPGLKILKNNSFIFCFSSFP